MDFEFGQSDRAEAFFRQHPNFWDAFQKVMTVSNRCFGRVCHYENKAQEIMFSLGQTCREDYLEILFMGVHGFDIATTKLLRGLYERAVTHAYIINDPEKVMRFIRFGAVQEYRLMKGALETGVSAEEFDSHTPPENSIAQITARRDEVKDEFKVEECEICGMEAPPSWDKRSIGAMAMSLKADPLYKALYLPAYVMTNLHIHATLLSAIYKEDAAGRRSTAVREGDGYFNRSCCLY